jgi:hypothetical protein
MCLTHLTTPPRHTIPRITPRRTRREQGGGRKLLQALAARHTEADSAELSVAASLALAKKLLGTHEDWSIAQLDRTAKQSWVLDTESLQALATGDVAGARRRLMQSVQAEQPAAGGALTSVVAPPAVPTSAR